jgi:thiamine pyrophosphate-dependent acetolactate synthase large subunit-like protein
MLDRASGLRVVSTKAYKIHGWRLSEEAMSASPLPSTIADLLDRFLKSPEPELVVFDCHPEANVFPMVPSGAALSEMILED